MPVEYRAPWSLGVKLVSGVATLLLVGITLTIVSASSGRFEPLLSLAPVALVAVTALFTVRGYELDGPRLSVRRLLWSTEVSLDGLRRAWADPTAMNRSLRLFGNGGFFSITGLFRNKRLGTYRAFATDPKRAVVLELPGRTFVVTPEEPDDLLRYLAASGAVVGAGPDAATGGHR